MRLVEGASEAPDDAGIFNGLETSIDGIARLAALPEGALRSELSVLSAAVRQALDEYEPRTPARIIPVLADGLRAARSARAALTSIPASGEARADADFLLAFKEEALSDAISRAAGVVVDALSSRETVVAGSALQVAVRTFYPDEALVRVTGAALEAPSRWTVAAAPGGSGNAGPRGETAADLQEYAVTVAADAQATQPYFMRQPREGDRYRWPDGAPKNVPFEQPLLHARVDVEIGGIGITLRQPVEYRFADSIRGEIRRMVAVVPPVTVAVSSSQLIIPLGTAPNANRVVVTTANLGPQPVSGMVRLRLPAGWMSTPTQAVLTLGADGDRTTTPFVITAPARRTAGRVDITAEAVVNGAMFSTSMQTIAYPHIQTHRLYRPASIVAQVVDVKVAAVRVGYLMGSGDQVPDAIRRLGVDVTTLSDETIATGDLSGFDTIVVGVRASEARPAFAAEHARLLEYVRAGGTLIVQYQQNDYTARGLPPYPAPAVGRGNSRVTVETAPVQILDPAHPVFTFPNRITAADFDGWVQERNLYAFFTVDPRYTPLLESADPGEPAQRGAQVYAEIGGGRYVYTAYSWFRQLPAGVPGAYRQFANLISLARAPRSAGSPVQGAARRTGAAAPLASSRMRPSR